MKREIGKISWFCEYNSKKKETGDYGYIKHFNGEEIQFSKDDIILSEYCAGEAGGIDPDKYLELDLLFKKDNLVTFEIQVNEKSKKKKAIKVLLLTDEIDPETIENIGKCIDDSSFRALLKNEFSFYTIEQIREYFKINNSVLTILDTHQQVEVVWGYINELPTKWKYLSNQAKIFIIYRITKENRNVIELLNNINGNENEFVKFAIILYKIKFNSKNSNEEFLKVHELFQDCIINKAWESSEPLEIYKLLPKCTNGKTYYCEGRLYFNEKEKILKGFCPRLRKSFNLSSKDCLHIYPDKSLDWENWSLVELLAETGLKPNLEGLKYPEEYINSMSGWINRLNEIRERMKCRICNSTMVTNDKYAKNLAVYRKTVFKCPNKCNNNEEIYINHCWACGKIIDSRDDRIKDTEGYYICIKCGSGKKHSTIFTQGDICPKCGEINMSVINAKEKQCTKCNHKIAVYGNVRKKVDGNITELFESLEKENSGF